MAELTPMMRQYLEVKKRCPDCLLFFRLGDFYEMFFEDAETASRELELVLTGRDCGLENRAPMCGIPHHASLSYISRLIGKGYKVAICEQMEDPATAKGIVKRDIVKIYTPGTVTDEQMLDKKVNNYIVSVYAHKNMYGIAAADISTGELCCTSLTIGSTFQHLADELARFAPREMVLNSDAENVEKIQNVAKNISNAFISMLPAEFFELDRCTDIVEGYTKTKLDEKRKLDFSVNAAGALIAYIADTQKMDLQGILKPVFYQANEFMAIDASSRRNLEITETLRDKAKRGSLLWVLDRTETAMGGRMLRRWLEQPLIDADEIRKRLDAVEELKDKFIVRSELRELMNGIYDIERLAGKIALGSVNARDLVSLRASLGKIPAIKEVLSTCGSEMLGTSLANIDDLSDLRELLEVSLCDDPPLSVKEGGIIRDGYNAEIDTCRRASRDGKGWLAELEAKEKESTGIKNLKVGYNRVFGYFIEVTKSYLELVPDHYIRKQTLANNERYITEELKNLEDTILGAEEKLIDLEYKCFVDIREYAQEQSDRLKATANAISTIDTLSSLAEVADRENYCKPEICDENVLDIKNGRHPVVEKMPNCEEFIPNDIFADNGENMMLVITGPNMAGKSTYMRQTALITLMAQCGSFVPADSARVGVADKIFTRVGASDDLASGQSTFMVEMNEVANILSNATERSLLILDEIGRGTSTFDGLSIAWSVLEYIAKNIKSRTLFATHYHELTELEGRIDGVKNYCVDVKRNGDEIIFLRKIKRGGADGSYGIAVAALAGIPKAVTIRAKEILSQLEEQDISRNGIKAVKNRKKTSDDSGAMDLFAYATATVMQDDIIEELKTVDIQSLTPIEALNVLYGLQKRAKDRK
ncbi:MAG: DNA mismatch repair protein MutS [Ruminococcaceae bacterium]|nr:DNA mismatch repair protein MutS [Oscillospiraceae bacterium]